ncbi:FadR/GntR family transcriptional regulator [Streptomyces viridochromogenes]|uniref:Putative GntR family L-asparagine operon transcriptional regulator (Repressor) n=1 Tax=Streptomyces viridochromogenes Tue57 TaxID=1160705 RepID=L8P4K6_STRVR|nr:FadR/GntR family transcriptional regulator [Streptomyces viridochromogenes]ELS51109.1 putative GntR family L-asparagine operon transcriptional regulator (Repressor) [Streptomyces viridochromogenes Tue57]
MSELSKITVERREPLAAEVSRRLIVYLTSGSVQPGDRIPSERRLTEMLGVNRPTVREAIKSLGFLGLLEIRQSSGTYFRGMDSDVLYRLFELGLVLGERGAKDMLQARAELEITVAGLAAEACDEAGVELLRSRLTTMRECSDTEFAEADTAFHATLAELAGNSILRDMLKGMRTMIQRGWVERTGPIRPREVAYADHVPIFEAVERGDAQAARTAMTLHMQAASRRLREALEQGTID